MAGTLVESNCREPKEPPLKSKTLEAEIIIGAREYVTPSGLSRELGVTVRTLSRWEERRMGPPRIKIGKLVLYDLAKLPDWLERHERQPLERRTSPQRRTS